MQCPDPLEEYLQKTYADDGYDNGGCDKNDFVDELNSCIFKTKGAFKETAKELVTISERLKINTAKNFIFSYCIL